MAELLASGRLVEAILALVVVEALLLIPLGRRRGIAPVRLLAMLAAGAFLLLALRAALVGNGALAIGGWLALAGLAHTADVVLRLRR